MASVYTVDTLYLTSTDGGDVDVFSGVRPIRIRTELDGFLTGQVEDDLEEILVFDLTTGDELDIAEVDAVELTFTVGGEQRQAVYLGLFLDDDDTGYVLLAEGDPLPTPPLGVDVDAFLASLGTQERALTDVPGTPYSAGSAVPFDDLESLVFVGETGQGIPEARARTVAYLYEAGLDRDGDIDEAGLNFWIDRAEGGFTNRDLADAFLRSGEFEAAFGDPDTLDDFAFVTVLYENVLDRAADDAGRSFWLGVLADPEVDRTQLLLAFASSNENRAGSAFVETLLEVEPGLWEFVL